MSLDEYDEIEFIANTKGELESKKEKVNAEQVETHIEILKERYAKGEITKEEFDKMKEDLS